MRVRKIKLPEWTEGLPDHVKLTSQDVMAIFGYKTSRGIGAHGLDKRGYIPMPDWQPVTRGSRAKKRKYWTLGNVRKFIKEHSERMEAENGAGKEESGSEV